MLGCRSTCHARAILWLHACKQAHVELQTACMGLMKDALRLPGHRTYLTLVGWRPQS